MSDICQRCEKNPATESRGYDEEWHIDLCTECAAWYDRKDEAGKIAWIDDIEYEIRKKEQGVQDR